MTGQEKAEMAAWLAENVMGWHIDGNRQFWCDADDRDVGFTCRPWAPLDDLNQAFMLVAKMRERHWWFRMRDAVVAPGGKAHAVASAGFDRGNEPIVANAPLGRPAEAICKAVKAAMEAGK